MEHGKIEPYHGSGQIIEFPEVRKARYTKEMSILLRVRGKSGSI